MYDDKNTGTTENSYRVDLSSKPPLGIMPRYIWIEERAIELGKAIGRYTHCGMVEETINWVLELKDILEELIEINNR